MEIQTKAQIRQMLKVKRGQLSEQERALYSKAITHTVTRHDWFNDAKKILCYHSFDHEVDTRQIINYCFSSHKRVFLPVVAGKQTMIPVEIRKDTELCKNCYQILEPVIPEDWVYEQMDLVLVPGLAFDLLKNRIGFGAGYYDQFFAEYPCLHKMGLAFDFQILDALPVGDFDIKMDKIVSERRILQ